ncbi:MAG: hypothetical protein LQ340_007011 [Diploschistes diacapsis]|nr:MAG: hypothetical protein LQ340_007011 [Diploschistes diacapsis]
MSSPAGGSGDKPPVLSRFIRRASKAIRPRSTRSSADTIEPATESRTVAVPRPSAATRAAPLAEHQISSAASYMKLREEKARALFAKYGMTLDSAEWSTPVPPNGTPQPEWIEKRIVMRVHRRCHRCQTSFGPDKTCSNCQHPRCKKCPRFPTKRSKDQRPGGEKYDPMAALAVDTAYKGRGNMLPITMPRDGKRDAVRKHPVHRVRRTCHRCETIFQGQATVCEKCKHQRCPQCPRDPYVPIHLLTSDYGLLTRSLRPKLKKWPEGYPGDIEETFPLALRVPKPVRTRYRWECHECRKPFIEHQKTCGQCQHERCDDCPRKPPKKVKKLPDPDVVRSVEEKMAALGLEAGSEAA